MPGNYYLFLSNPKLLKVSSERRKSRWIGKAARVTQLYPPMCNPCFAIFILQLIVTNTSLFWTLIICLAPCKGPYILLSHLSLVKTPCNKSMTCTPQMKNKSPRRQKTQAKSDLLWTHSVNRKASTQTQGNLRLLNMTQIWLYMLLFLKPHKEQCRGHMPCHSQKDVLEVLVEVFQRCETPRALCVTPEDANRYNHSGKLFTSADRS
jgi:hypothetical protein